MIAVVDVVVVVVDDGYTVVVIVCVGICYVIVIGCAVGVCCVVDGVRSVVWFHPWLSTSTSTTPT